MRDALVLPVFVLAFVLVLGAMDGVREDADADAMLGAPLRIVRAVPSVRYHAGYYRNIQSSSLRRKKEKGRKAHREIERGIHVRRHYNVVFIVCGDLTRF